MYKTESFYGLLQSILSESTKDLYEEEAESIVWLSILNAQRHNKYQFKTWFENHYNLNKDTNQTLQPNIFSF